MFHCTVHHFLFLLILSHKKRKQRYRGNVICVEILIVRVRAMNQPRLFDDDRYEPPTIARASDPATSRAGAEHIAPQLGQKAACMMKVLRFASMTANEAARGCAVTYGGLAETYRKRVKELERAGLIRKQSIRCCDVTGQPATVYEVIQ